MQWHYYMWIVNSGGSLMSIIDARFIVKKLLYIFFICLKYHHEYVLTRYVHGVNLLAIILS